jgi:transcriptional regulator with XRE-family HTH domain
MPPQASPELRLAAHLRSARGAHGFTQSDVAEMLRERGFVGHTQQTVSRIENTGRVYGVDLLMLADVLGVKLDCVKIKEASAVN